MFLDQSLSGFAVTLPRPCSLHSPLDIYEDRAHVPDTIILEV